MKVRAKEMALYHGQRRRPGQVFDLLKGDKLRPWMEPLDAPTKPVAKVPDTFSEIAKSSESKTTKPPRTFSEIAKNQSLPL